MDNINAKIDVIRSKYIWKLVFTITLTRIIGHRIREESDLFAKFNFETTNSKLRNELNVSLFPSIATIRPPS